MHRTFLCLAATALVGWGQAPAIPAGGTSVFAPGAGFRLQAREAGSAEMTVVEVTGQPFTQALRLRTKAKPTSPWFIQAQLPSGVALKKGDVCLATFFARATETSNETADGVLGVVFERHGAPNTKSLNRTVTLNREWRQFCLPFVMAESYEPGAAQCNLVIGVLPQCVEVGGLEVLTYGDRRRLNELPLQGSLVSYPGRAADAPWRQQAAARIEQYRKGDLTVVVTGPDGKPVPGANVTVAMQRHAYQFGAAVTAKMLTADTPDAQRYRDLVEQTFNIVVFENDLKYGPWVQGAKTTPDRPYNRANTLAALKWLKERQIYVRGHCLLWGPLDKRHYGAWTGFDFDAADPAPNRPRIEQHVDDILRQTNGLVDEWDVVNHPVATWGDKGRCWSDLFGQEIYADLYRRARQANPAMRLFINEGSDFPGDNEGVRQRYADLIGWLQEQQAPLDGIGFMCHFGASTLASPDFVYQHLERYAKYGLPMRATELDVSTDGDEQAQADYYRDFMTMFFSHPQTVGIIMWGFWEGKHWHPDRALWRKNWEIKPCGQAWLDLVQKQWWTNTTDTTAADGSLRVRGFLGDYRVTVTVNGKAREVTVSLPKAGTICTVQLP